MPAFFKISILDYDAEVSHVQFQGVSMGSVNFAAQEALQNTLETALNAITIGTIHKRTRLASSAVISSTLPGAGAQRELKWLVSYHDDVTGKKYRLEIPCADTSLLESNGPRLDPSSGAYTDFKAAFEAYVVQGEAPDNAVVLDEIRLVGRNL